MEDIEGQQNHFFNYYDYGSIEDNKKVKYHIESIFPNFISGLEKIIIGMVFLFILLYLLILSSNTLYIFFKTSFRKPFHNFAIFFDIITLTNPVIR